MVRSADGTLLNIVEQQDADSETKQIDEVNLGIYSLDFSAVADLLTQMVSDDLAAGSIRQESYLPRLVQVLNQEGLGVVVHSSQAGQQFLQVNDRQGLARVSRVMQDKIHQQLLADGVTIVDPATTWIESDVEIGQDTIIHPQTVIRRGVRIGPDCEVGPFAHLRSGSVLEDDVKVGDFVEINRSHLSTGVRAKHLAYLGDSAVGAGANIGAGVVVANYDGKNKTPTVIGPGAFVGSGSVIVAPGDIGENSIVGAGAVVPPGRHVEPGSTVVGVPARKIKRNDDSVSEIRDDERENL
jgi:bifunctional UDP-N-acetylglucosamine pyrophosphorylase/glucosamine-1-phosphate N-acetyltransferase